MAKQNSQSNRIEHSDVLAGCDLDSRESVSKATGYLHKLALIEQKLIGNAIERLSLIKSARDLLNNRSRELAREREMNAVRKQGLEKK